MAGTRWQYHIVTDRAALPELGLEGWELVSVAVLQGLEQFYLKRPAPSVSEEITLSQRAHVLAQKTAEEGGKS